MTPGGRPRLDHVDRPLLGRRRGHHAAVRLHHVEGRGRAEGGEPGLERVHVARHDRHHRRVHGGGAPPQVLAELRAHLRRDGQPGVRHLLAHDRRGGALVGGVQVGVQEADHHRLHALVPQAAHRRAHLADVERLQHASLGVETLADLEAPSPGHQRRRLLQMHVVEPGADLPADLQDVAEAARHEHAHARRLALDDGVGRHGGGVDHRGHVAAPGPAFREAALAARS